MHKRMSPHGDYDHMGDAIYLVNNYDIDRVIFNWGETNDLEYGLINVLENSKIYRTDLDGTVEVVFNNKAYKISNYSP